MSIRPDEGSVEGGNLTISTVKKSDEGVYKCKAVNRYGEIEHSGRLVVREPTIITVHPQDKTVNASEDVELKCSAETDKAEERHLTITWTKNGEPIDYQNEPRISKNNQNHSLMIKGATVEDTSQYTCVAGNGLDKDEHTVSVTVKDRPDPPTNLRLLSCTSKAEIEWVPGKDNNEEIIEFIVYYNTSFDESGVFHKAESVSRDVTRATISLSPWSNYTFHVIARNRLGTSDKSNFTPSKCTTPEDIPYKHPENVCTESREETQLVITWDIMEKIDHNGQGFHYRVSWRRLDGSGITNSEQVTDWQIGEYVVEGRETFKEFEIAVQARNNEGPAPDARLKKMIGYSGEGKPRDSPSNFDYDEDSLNSTSVIFMWDPVDDSPDNIRGHFIGYEVVYWKVDAPEEKRTHLTVLSEAVPCLPADGARRRHRRQASADEPSAHVLDLWPYSQIAAGVSVRNSKSSGELSPTIEFSTPEGVPGMLPMFEVRERGSHHLGVAWAPPIPPNGVISGYLIRWQRLDKPFEPAGEKFVLDPTKRYTKIKGLDESTDYRLFIAAQTGAGLGEEYVTESSTLEAGSPDVPGFAGLDVGDTSVNVSWTPTDEDYPTRNPGSEFFVEYRKKDSEDGWSRAEPLDDDHHHANVSGLDFGDEYEFVIVAVNGAGQETRSETKTVAVGVQPEPRVMGIARAGWFIGMMCAIVFLLIVLIIVCLIRRNRGGKYPVHEKEKLRGRDPDRDDEERGFGEYTKTPYMELKSDEPDYIKSAGSLESESKPLGESDSDSMAEYEDTDPGKFNEDGSFIGQYGGKKKSKDKMEPDATSPSALSTFV